MKKRNVRRTVTEAPPFSSHYDMRCVIQGVAQRFGDIWIHDALESKARQLVKAAKAMSSHKACLLDYFKHKMTNGMDEGLNNKIKTLRRQTYGFRGMEYLKLRLYNLHTQKYSLSG